MPGTRALRDVFAAALSAALVLLGAPAFSSSGLGFDAAAAAGPTTAPAAGVSGGSERFVLAQRQASPSLTAPRQGHGKAFATLPTPAAMGAASAAPTEATALHSAPGSRGTPALGRAPPPARF